VTRRRAVPAIGGSTASGTGIYDHW